MPITIGRPDKVPKAYDIKLSRASLSGLFRLSDPTFINHPEELYIEDLQLIKTGCTASTTQINMIISGGDEPYRWYYSKGNAAFVDFTSEDQLTPGTYQFKALDNNDCEVNYGQEVVITEDAINLSAIVTPVCYKSENGSLEAEVLGGDGPYHYSIDNGASFQNEAIFDYRNINCQSQSLAR